MSVNLPGEGSDRRTAQREPIRRRVVFAGVRGEGLLRQGMAVDISASGLLIHTSQPDQPGRHLEIELHPDGIETPGDVIMVRGEVVWTRPHDVKGEFAMGVHFLQSFPATDMTGAGYRPATRDEGAEMAASIQRRLAAMEPAVRLEISDAARQRGAAPAAPPPRTQPPGSRRSYRWLWLLLLLLGFGSVVSTATIATLWQLGVYRSKPTPPAAEELPPELESRDTDPSPDPSSLVDERIKAALDSGPDYHLNRGSLFLIQGRFPAAAQAFNTAQARPDATPVERFIAELGEAQALASDGSVDEALEVLARPWEELEGVPQPWQDLREEFLAVLNASPDSEEARAPLVNAFAFQPAQAGEAGTNGPVGDTMRVEIDTTRHLLNVLENNSIKAVYPIGLGARGKTPEGDFTIINKIENPEWYNQGNPIPPGDPENELGSRWIGLADESGPTPVGIHATDELESIGANQSRGCIRMRPADVEELFTFVTVGTPVSIRAL